MNLNYYYYNASLLFLYLSLTILVKIAVGYVFKMADISSGMVDDVHIAMLIHP